MRFAGTENRRTRVVAYATRPSRVRVRRQRLSPALVSNTDPTNGAAARPPSCYSPGLSAKRPKDRGSAVSACERVSLERTLILAKPDAGPRGLGGGVIR